MPEEELKQVDKNLVDGKGEEMKNVVKVATDDSDEDNREPKLYVEVNVANFGLKRIIIYEGDTVESLVAAFVKNCPIDAAMTEKLKTLLQEEMNGVLERIIENDEGDEEGEDHHEESKGLEVAAVTRSSWAGEP